MNVNEKLYFAAVTDGDECMDMNGQPVCENGASCEDMEYGFTCDCDFANGDAGETCQCEYTQGGGHMSW